MKKIKIIAISVARSDYDRYLPILNQLYNNRKVELKLFISKDHLNPKFGKTINFIDKKFKLIKKNYNNFDFLKDQRENLSDDLSFFNKKIKSINPNLIIVLGDRYEMLLGPALAIPNKIPLAHFFGGAVTEGSADELTRHALTKMSHIHFVALKEYKKRLLQLGEESWRVYNIGIPSLQSFKDIKFKNRNCLTKKIKFNFNNKYALLTYHPALDELDKIKENLDLIEKVIKKENLNLIITYPNSDLGNKLIINYYKKKFINKKKFKIIKNCGQDTFLNIAKYSNFMIGNSSSGIVESASLKIPVINLGNRQKGKLHPKNVINCSFNERAILAAIKKIKSNSYSNSISNLKNPYEKKNKLNISNILLKLIKNKKILNKKFINFNKKSNYVR